MEISIKKNGSSKYYNEVLAVISNYKKLIENLRQKIRPLNTQAITLTGISVVFLVIFTFMYLQNPGNILYLAVVIIFAIALVLGIIYNILIKRRVSKFKRIDVEKTLIIEDDYVELIVGNERSRLEMSEIQYVVINKYSICFIPTNLDSILIAVEVDYKDSVIKAIGNNGLIIDNSSLYQ